MMSRTVAASVVAAALVAGCAVQQADDQDLGWVTMHIMAQTPRHVVNLTANETAQYSVLVVLEQRLDGLIAAQQDVGSLTAPYPFSKGVRMIEEIQAHDPGVWPNPRTAYVWHGNLTLSVFVEGPSDWHVN